jgi:hypothetical protein
VGGEKKAAKKAAKAYRAKRRYGPLGPYRFALSVAATAALWGPSLAKSAGTDRFESDCILALGFGVVCWLASGVIDRALADARLRALAESRELAD